MHPFCPFCKHQNQSSDSSSVVRNGHFSRKSDQIKIQRFKCITCNKTFSEASFEFHYWQKQRLVSWSIFELLSSGVSQRRSALILKINRKTLVHKFIQLGEFSLKALPYLNSKFKKSMSVEFDDLETFEHSKCKPLSVIMAVESGSRRVLGFKVARMPAKGRLVHIALKKYGPRIDERAEKRSALFKELISNIEQDAVIKSDQNPHYGPDVRKYFPNCVHEVFKGRRGCVVGQGELKAGGWDPLFTLNHTFAMFRANMNRLFRRTWCTTKKPERLAYHLGIYALYHNFVLLNLRPEKLEPLLLLPPT